LKAQESIRGAALEWNLRLTVRGLNSYK